MTQIDVRREASPARAATPWPNPLDAFRSWRDLMRWDPFAGMLPSPGEERASFAPSFDVKETKDSFVFKADLPGVEPNDVQVQLRDNRLTIAGKREYEKEEKTDTTYRCERTFGSFSRSFTLPVGTDADKVNAELKNGVLTVLVPRKPEAAAKQIAVKAAS